MPYIREIPVVQTYETSIYHRYHNWGFAYIVVPRRSGRMLEVFQSV
jgi:hypothetical protein